MFCAGLPLKVLSSYNSRTEGLCQMKRSTNAAKNGKGWNAVKNLEDPKKQNDSQVIRFVG